MGMGGRKSDRLKTKANKNQAAKKGGWYRLFGFLMHRMLLTSTAILLHF